MESRYNPENHTLELDQRVPRWGLAGVVHPFGKVCFITDVVKGHHSKFLVGFVVFKFS